MRALIPILAALLLSGCAGAYVAADGGLHRQEARPAGR